MSIKRVRGTKTVIDTTPIEDDPQAFIERAREEHRTIEGNYITQRWKIVEKCAIAVAYARKIETFENSSRTRSFGKMRVRNRQSIVLIGAPSRSSAQEQPNKGRQLGVTRQLLNIFSKKMYSLIKWPLSLRRGAGSTKSTLCQRVEHRRRKVTAVVWRPHVTMKRTICTQFGNRRNSEIAFWRKMATGCSRFE